MLLINTTDESTCVKLETLCNELGLQYYKGSFNEIMYKDIVLDIFYQLNEDILGELSSTEARFLEQCILNYFLISYSTLEELYDIKYEWFYDTIMGIIYNYTSTNTPLAHSKI